LLQQEQFQVALKSSEAFFKHKMSDFQSVMQLKDTLMREILIAQWIEQRQKRLLNQTHIESLIEYCWANQLLDAFQIWKLLTFAKLNFDLDEKAQSIAQNSLRIYFMSVVTKQLLKYGVKTLTAGFAEWVEDSLEDLVSDQFSKFKDQYQRQRLHYVPYTKFCESIWQKKI
jgi:hypothetical protein